MDMLSEKELVEYVVREFFFRVFCQRNKEFLMAPCFLHWNRNT